MTEPRIETFVTSDGYNHHYRHWSVPERRPRGYVVALHGIQSHSGWYTYSSEKLCEAGYDVVFLDRRGSGMNAEDRGHARHQDRLVNDVAHVLTEVRYRRNEVAPTAPVVLLGLSWGGKLAATMAAGRPELVDALVLLYPGIFAQVQATAWDNFRLSLAQFFDVLEKRVPVPLQDSRLFTNQEQWRDFLQRDALALREVTVSFLLANRELDKSAQASARDIRCPVYMALAGRDRIIDNESLRQYFQRLGTQQRKLVEYPEACHTLEFEPDRDRVIADLIVWLDELPQAM